MIPKFDGNLVNFTADMKHRLLTTILVAICATLLPVLAVSSYVGLGKKVRAAAGGPASVVSVHPHEEQLELSEKPGRTTVFLAGTIDMGSSIDWQAQADSLFAAAGSGRYMLFNPRQENWDASRPGEMDYQVNWELEHLEEADHIIMNFLPDSKSPITLLELGLHARSGKLLVICPEEFYRYDNVRITCGKYGVRMFGSLEEAIMHICGSQKQSSLQ